MDFSDRFFIASLLTLALFVLVLEKRNRMIEPQLKIPTDWNVRDINIPQHRAGTRVVEDVAYIDMQDAADAGNE